MAQFLAVIGVIDIIGSVIIFFEIAVNAETVGGINETVGSVFLIGGIVYAVMCFLQGCVFIYLARLGERVEEIEKRLNVNVWPRSGGSWPKS